MAARSTSPSSPAVGPSAPFHRHDHPDATLAQIGVILDGWAAFDAIGVGSFGPVGTDPAATNHRTVTATSKPGWSNAPVLATLAGGRGVPVGFATDVIAATLAERRLGTSHGAGVRSYVTIGTGVGVGVISRGAPLHGVTHGEAGHIRIRRAGGDRFGGTCPFYGDCLGGLVSARRSPPAPTGRRRPSRTKTRCGCASPTRWPS